MKEPTRSADLVEKVPSPLISNTNLQLRTWFPYAKPGVIVYGIDREHSGKGPATAWYEPKTGDAYIDWAAVGFWSPPTGHISHEDNVKLAGMTAHELAHSRWSTMDRAALPKDRAVRTILLTLEEVRIEAFASRYGEYIAGWLRASLDVVMGTGRSVPKTKFGAARTWLLVYGRVFSGVIDHDELEWLDIAARTILGDDIVDELQDLIGEAVTLDVNDAAQYARYVQIAERIVELVGRPAVGEGEDEGGCSHDEEGEESETETTRGGRASESDEDESEDEAGEAGDEAEETDESGETGGEAGDDEDDDSDEEAGDDVDAEGEPDDGADDSAGEDDSHVDRSGKVHKPDDTDVEYIDETMAERIKEFADEVIADASEHWDRDGDGKLADPAATEVWKRKFAGEKQKPKAHHRQTVTIVARALDRLTLPAITKRKVSRVTPPGRLRSREAVRASAELAQGRMVTARPWESTKRTHTAAKVLRVGIMTDTSGSMGWAEQAVADFAFVWANAGNRVGARTAAVTFGDRARAVVHPGEIPHEIRKAKANGGWENFDEAAAAMDNVLRLSANDGASKLIIVVSDGELVGHMEPEKARKWIAQWEKAGTTVVWLTPTFGTRLIRHLQKESKTVVRKVEKYDPNVSQAVNDAGLEAISAIIAR